jgi:hypothetical protein
MERITYEEEKIFFARKPNLFTIGTIPLSKLKFFNAVIFGAKVNTKDLSFNFSHIKEYILVDTMLTHIKV